MTPAPFATMTPSPCWSAGTSAAVVTSRQTASSSSASATARRTSSGLSAALPAFEPIEAVGAAPGWRPAEDACCLCLGIATEDDVAEPGVAGLWEVGAIVGAPALFPDQRRLGRQAARSQQVRQLVRGAVGRGGPVDSVPRREKPLSLRQRGAVADD